MRLDPSAKRGQPGVSGQKQSRNPANAADERASPLESVMQVNDCIENRTFDEIAVGESASLTRTLSKDDIALFAVMSGDVNPTHLDERYAETSTFHRITAHGMWSGALVSAVLGTRLPGHGTVYLGQDLRFRKPVGLGDTVTVYQGRQVGAWGCSLGGPVAPTSRVDVQSRPAA